MSEECTTWTLGQWVELDVGGRETERGTVEFGSWMALNAMLTLVSGMWQRHIDAQAEDCANAHREAPPRRGELELAQPKVVELATRSRLVDLLEVQLQEEADEWYALAAAYARALDAIPGEDILRFVTKHGFALGGYVEGKPVAVLGAPPPSAPPWTPPNARHPLGPVLRLTTTNENNMEDKADLKRDLAWARENITGWAVMQGIAQHIAIGSLVVAAVWGSNTVAVVLANHIEDGHSIERTPRDAFNRGWTSAT